jgi:hypothetical protein
MGRVLIYLVILLLIAAAGGALYAVLVDLPPPTKPVEIELPGAAIR